METDLLRITGILIGLVFVFSLLPQSAATIVWSDNFDDGNFDGWTVTEGSCDASSEYLVGVYNGELRHKIWYPSSQIVGTWSFDVYPGDQRPEQGGGTIEVEFMGNGTDRYMLSIRPSNDYDALHVYFKNNNFPLGYVEIEGGLDTWTHYDVTRNSTGGLSLYVNATSTTDEPVLTAADTMYSYSDRFTVIFHYREDSRIDNVVVDDEILFPYDTTTSQSENTTTTTTTNGGATFPIDTTLLIAGAGVAGVVIIAAVVCMRRR
ncbi:MAG: hypothetical protein ACXACG_02220 [Candidatus Thorarchaeota archaeon]